MLLRLFCWWDYQLIQPDPTKLPEEIVNEHAAEGKTLDPEDLKAAVQHRIDVVAGIITTATAVLLQKDPDIALDTGASALESNYAQSAMAAALPAVGEGLCYVAAGTTLAAGAAVVGSVCVGGVIYYLVAESTVNPAVHKALVDDGESDYDKIMAMEAARKLRAEQQAMLAATSATAATTTTTAAFMGQPRGPSIFSTPPPTPIRPKTGNTHSNDGSNIPDNPRGHHPHLARIYPNLDSATSSTCDTDSGCSYL